MSDFLIRRDDLRETRIDEADPPEAGAGEALLRVDAFGLTANNITYAVFGEAMNYWDFFPAPEGWGRLPMWGFADVQSSNVDGLTEGARVFGYLPSSTHLVVRPALDPRGFVDEADHRKPLPATYQRYQYADSDPFYEEDTEQLQMLLRPLFFTSFLIADQIDDEGLAEDGPVVIASASSKTAIAAAYLLAQSGDVELVALTSPRSRPFVEGLELYNRVVTYDDVAALGSGPATFVDIAGDAEVRHAVHSHFGDELSHSMAVGATHWEDMDAADGASLPGPQPKFFFAPTRVDKRSADWGPAKLNETAAQAWQGFCRWTGEWLKIERGQGLGGLQAVYPDVLENRVEPTTAHVISLAG